MAPNGSGAAVGCCSRERAAGCSICHELSIIFPSRLESWAQRLKNIKPWLYDMRPELRNANRALYARTFPLTIDCDDDFSRVKKCKFFSSRWIPLMEAPLFSMTLTAGYAGNRNAGITWLLELAAQPGNCKNTDTARPVFKLRDRAGGLAGAITSHPATLAPLAFENSFPPPLSSPLERAFCYCCSRCCCCSRYDKILLYNIIFHVPFISKLNGRQTLTETRRTTTNRRRVSFH